METPIYTLQDRALEKAKKDLASQGILDPMSAGRLMTTLEMFDESLRYSEKLAQLAAHYMKQPSGIRPLIPLSETSKERKPYKDD